MGMQTALGTGQGRLAQRLERGPSEGRAFHFLEKLNDVVFLISSAMGEMEGRLGIPTLPTAPSRMPWVPVHTLSPQACLVWQFGGT